jgi:hypothetical protein
MNKFPSDPVLSDVVFPHRAVLYPLGFPLEIETNSPDVIEAAKDSWIEFPQQFAVRPVRVSIGVSNEQHGVLSPPPVVRSRAHLMSIVGDSENFLHCDFDSGFVFGWVSHRTVTEKPFFRHHFIGTSVLTTIQQLYLAPLHGALVAKDGKGVALCGESCAGKSSMAYACARTGWTFVADDATFLLREHPHRYAIGNPHRIHLREGARQLFPELAHYHATTRPNGKYGLEIPTRNLPITTAAGCSVEHVVFLNRHGSDGVQLTPCSTVRAQEWCAQFAQWGDQRVRSHQAQTYSRLAKCQVWEIEYRDLDDAVQRLGELF